MSTGDPQRYAVDYENSPAHRQLVGVLAELPGRGMVVDLGGGHAPHAEQLVELGFSYAGLDTNEVALAEVRARGHHGHRCDLADLGELERVLNELADAHEVVAVTAIDVIEHLVEPEALLVWLHGWMGRRGVPTLAVSVPNVAHHDLGLKLLAGRWDVTETGLLDATHLRFFTDESLSRLMVAAGFDEQSRADVVAERSDQPWSVHHPMLNPSTPVGAFLRGVRSLVDRHGETYQFVRSYTRIERHGPPPRLVGAAEQDRPLLSVVLAEGDAPGIPASGSTGDVEFVADPGDLGAGVGRLDRMIGAARGHSVLVTESTPGVELLDAIRSAVTARPGAVVIVDRTQVALPTTLVRGLRLGDAWSTTTASALVAALAPLCGVSRLDRTESDVYDPSPFWSGPTLTDPSVRYERDALRDRVAELERWSASLVADNDALNAQLRRTPVRVVSRLTAVGSSAWASVRSRARR